MYDTWMKQLAALFHPVGQRCFVVASVVAVDTYIGGGGGCSFFRLFRYDCGSVRAA